MNIYSRIESIAEEFPSKVLVSIDDEVITCASFLDSTKILSNALLAAGVIPQQKVAMILPNSAFWFTLYWSVVKIGAIPVPLDPQIGEWEIEQLFSLTKTEICFASSHYRANNILAHVLNVKQHLPTLKQIIFIDNNTSSDETIHIDTFTALTGTPNAGGNITYTPTQSDTLMLACTSGSTGNPKIISVPHVGFYQSQKDMGEYLGFSAKDIMLLGMPLYHQGGFGIGLQMTLQGGTVSYQPKFDPITFLQIIEKHQVTAIQLTATLAKIILSVPDFESYSLASLKLAYFAGEVLPMEIAREFFEKRGIRVVNVIGSSETATMVVWDSESDRDADVNEFRPLPFTKLKVLDDDLNEVPVDSVGSIFIHTDALITDYFKNEKETKLKLIPIDGISWFNTGDLGQKLSNGRVRFAGRAKRIIKRGANLIYPEELESYLLTHPNIEAVAVTSEKHELIGEMVVAHIQAKDGVTITRGDIVNFCRGKLAAYKIPDQVIVMKEIPHDIGKVQFKYIKKDTHSNPNRND